MRFLLGAIPGGRGIFSLIFMILLVKIAGKGGGYTVGAKVEF